MLTPQRDTKFSRRPAPTMSPWVSRRFRPDHPADVYFDMEGYPLFVGGLEYLFGVSSFDGKTGSLDFNDWWAHNRDEEKLAFEGFIDWVHQAMERKSWHAHLPLRRLRG